MSIMRFQYVKYVTAVLVLLVSADLVGQILNPNRLERLRQQTRVDVKSRIDPILTRYCGQACEIINVRVDIDEVVPETDDLGFESVEQQAVSDLIVNRVYVDIQIDNKVTATNRDRLERILANNLRHYGLATEIDWDLVEIPQIGQSASQLQIMQRNLEKRVSKAIMEVIEEYCPDTCILSNVLAVGRLISADEAAQLDPIEVTRSSSGRYFFHIEDIEVLVSLSDELDNEDRQKILNVMRAKTRFVAPVRVVPTVAPFPETYASKRERLAIESADPYGLEKLRRTLTLFRDLAGTKEIISSESENGDSWVWYLVMTIFLLGCGGGLLWYYLNAQQNAQLMMDGPEGESGESGGEKEDGADEKVSLRLRNEELRQELIEIFIEAPRVAKETFSRLLQEEGPEETAKYVHIFGKLIVFELLNDPNLQRNLYELSEYYHKSSFEFDSGEEWRLLMALRTKVTANEIRVLTRKTMDQFDFLLRLDPTQIFNLVRDEKPQVQGIVLTQVEPRRRRAVFEMFEGKAKVDLLRELCKADAIPKEYLANVAKALAKKVVSKPEFDTQNLRSSDILLDLLERSALPDQRALMRNLTETNPDAARAIKLKLVTVEVLPYLKGGQLLELVLGMDREDLLSFLGGAPEHIRGLLLTHAPEELAESWLEDLETMAGVDEGKYRLTEMKILGKVRNFASNGTISLLDINEMLFTDGEQDPVGEAGDDGPVGEPEVSHLVA